MHVLSAFGDWFPGGRVALDQILMKVEAAAKSQK